MDIISEGLVLGQKQTMSNQQAWYWDSSGRNRLCPVSRPGTGTVVDYRVSVELLLGTEANCFVSIERVLGL